MMVTRTQQQMIKGQSHWLLSGPLGEQLQLPAASSGPFAIGTLGTRSLHPVPTPRWVAMARMFLDLGLPLYLIDVRLDGCGAMGCWSPREFAAMIPAWLAQRGAPPMSYLHLPGAAPGDALQRAYRWANKHPTADSEEQIASWVVEAAEGRAPGQHSMWRHHDVFRAAYKLELTRRPHAVLAARAFVEAAQREEGMAVFLCAEPLAPSFDQLPREDVGEALGKNNLSCHRFSLAAAVSDSLAVAFPGEQINRVDLDLGA